MAEKRWEQTIQWEYIRARRAEAKNCGLWVANSLAMQKHWHALEEHLQNCAKAGPLETTLQGPAV